MMKIIDRYLVKEIAVPFIGVLLVLTIILSLGKIAQSVELILGRGIGLLDTLKLILVLLPSSLQFTIPIALLVAILIGMGRLSDDNEFTILKSAGMSLFRVSAPMVAFSLAIVALSFLITFFVIPQSNYKTKQLIFEMIRKQASLGIEGGRFTDSFSGVLVYAGKVDPHTAEVEDIFISDTRMAQEPTIVVAKRAALMGDDEKMNIKLHLLNGSIHMTNGNLSYYRHADFASYTVNLDVAKALRAATKGSTDMTFGELKKKIDETAEGPNRRELLIELNKKITVPLSCLSFCFLAIPLGIRSQRAVRSRGFIVGFALALVYFSLSTGGDALAETGMISPTVSAWLPLGVFSLVGGLLYYLVAKEVFIPTVDFNVRLAARAVRG